MTLLNALINRLEDPSDFHPNRIWESNHTYNF